MLGSPLFAALNVINPFLETKLYTYHSCIFNSFERSPVTNTHCWSNSSNEDPLKPLDIFFSSLLNAWQWLQSTPRQHLLQNLLLIVWALKQGGPFMCWACLWYCLFLWSFGLGAFGAREMSCAVREMGARSCLFLLFLFCLFSRGNSETEIHCDSMLCGPGWMLLLNNSRFQFFKE